MGLGLGFRAWSWRAVPLLTVYRRSVTIAAFSGRGPESAWREAVEFSEARRADLGRAEANLTPGEVGVGFADWGRSTKDCEMSVRGGGGRGSENGGVEGGWTERREGMAAGQRSRTPAQRAEKAQRRAERGTERRALSTRAARLLRLDELRGALCEGLGSLGRLPGRRVGQEVSTCVEGAAK